MPGVHVVDIAVLVVYFVGITLIGLWAARRVKNMGDFFMPRTFGKTMLVAHAFGTGTHSDQAVGMAAKTFVSGLSGIWYQWLWLFCTPFYWLIAPLMRRFRAITVSDVFVLRYGESVGMLFAVVGTFNLMFNIGVMLKGSGAVISATLGDRFSPEVIILVVTALFVVYGVTGGLSAAIITDFVQGILTIIFSFALLPSVLHAVGGISGLRETIGDPHMFSLTAPGDITAFYIAVIALNAMVDIVTQPHTMGNCAAGRTESDGRFGFTVGSFIKRICTMAWCITGLAAVGFLAGREVEPDKVYGVMAHEFFPAAMPGLLGIFIASLLASVMSSCDSFMIASSALFTEDLYKPLLPNKSARHYLWVGRFVALGIVAGGLASAYLIEDVVQGIEIFWKIAPMLGIAFWLGLFWRRTTTAGAWASTLAAFAVLILTGLSPVVELAGRLAPSLVKADGSAMMLHWQMVFYLTAGFWAGIIVSLLTKPPSEGKLERFYALVRTPVDVGEGSPEEPCTIPEGVVVPEKQLMLKAGGLEVLKPGIGAIVGFAVAWGAVGALIFGFYWLTR